MLNELNLVKLSGVSELVLPLASTSFMHAVTMCGSDTSCALQYATKSDPKTTHFATVLQTHTLSLSHSRMIRKYTAFEKFLLRLTLLGRAGTVQMDIKTAVGAFDGNFGEHDGAADIALGGLCPTALLEVVWLHFPLGRYAPGQQRGFTEGRWRRRLRTTEIRE